MSIREALGTRSELRSMETTLLAELLTEIRKMQASNTGALEVLRSNIINNVLASAVVVLDVNGQASESYQTPFGSLAIANHGTTDMTVVASSPASSAPSKGRGQGKIPAGTFLVDNLAGSEWTLYGAAGDAATVQVFTKPQPPTTGPAAAVGTVANPLNVLFTNASQMAGFNVIRDAESTTPLGVGATFNGSAKDFGSGSTGVRTRLAAFVNTDQGGTLNLQQAIASGGPWFTTDTAAIVASTPLVLEAKRNVLRFARVQLVNGGVAQTTLELDSCRLAL